VLRPGGILSITEMSGDPDVTSQDEVLRISGQNGFQFLEHFSFFRGFTINLLTTK